MYWLQPKQITKYIEYKTGMEFSRNKAEQPGYKDHVCLGELF